MQPPDATTTAATTHHTWSKSNINCSKTADTENKSKDNFPTNKIVQREVPKKTTDEGGVRNCI